MSNSIRPCITGCVSLGSNPHKTNEILNKILTEKQNHSSELALKELHLDPELRVNVMKTIIASFNCEIHHEMIIKEKIDFVIWMIGEYSLSSSDIDYGLSVIKRSIGELPFPNDQNQNVQTCHWFEECRRRLVIEKDAKLQTQIAIALTKLIEKLHVFITEIAPEKFRQEQTEAARLIASMKLLPKPVNLRPLTFAFYNGEIGRCMRSICHQDKELKWFCYKATGENLVNLFSKKLYEDKQRVLCDQALYHFEAIFLGTKNTGEASEKQ